jgi:excisionase family DNA binding protein
VISHGRKDSHDRGSEKVAAQSGEITQSDKKKLSSQKERKLSRIELLAKRLNIPRSTIYELAKQGKIPCGRIGKRYLIPEDAEQRVFEWAYRNWRPPPEAKPPRRKEGQPDDQTASETTIVPSEARTRTPTMIVRDNSPPITAAKPRRTGNAWLSPRQVAKWFGVGTSAVYGAVARGEVPAVRLGRHIRIPHDVVDKLLHYEY